MKKVKFIMVLMLLFVLNSNAQSTVKKSKAVAINTADYTSFGSKFAVKNVLDEKQMLKKYKTLKNGDSIKVQFKSKIKEVCKKKGCWMQMNLSDEKQSFVKFKDYAFFVPLNADNYDAILNGIAFVNIVSVSELKHYAKDGGKSQEEINKITKPETTYSFMADGVLIKK